MRVLFVARKKNGKYAPFITEQVEAISNKGIDSELFGITKNGFWGYLNNIYKLKTTIKAFQPDIIHAHYGLCGVLANMQRRVPVVTTYHGSDINNSRILPYSKWSIHKSTSNIFVSLNGIKIAKPKGNYELIPCGINLQDYPFIEKDYARQMMELDKTRKYVLFASAFDNYIKNAPLAKASVEILPEVDLLELKGYTRAQVATLLQAVDALLMTSFTEGSPQVIKEAMACGCPIVSVDVGDVKSLIDGVDGCYISERTPEAISSFVMKAFEYGKRTDARNIIIRKGLTNDKIADRIINVYNSLV